MRVSIATERTGRAAVPERALNELLSALRPCRPVLEQGLGTQKVIAMIQPKAKETFGRIVSDGEVEKALNFLRDSAQETGEARGRLAKAGHMIKHVEALLTLASDQKSVEAKKCEAKTSQRWIDAVDEERDATIEWEKLKALREAADAKIRAWQSESANFRGLRA